MCKWSTSEGRGIVYSTSLNYKSEILVYISDQIGSPTPEILEAKLSELSTWLFFVYQKGIRFSLEELIKDIRYILGL